MAMSVSDAIKARKSCRAFTDEPVDAALVTDLLEQAAWAPSGGNVQPWRVWVLAGDDLDAFTARIVELRGEFPMGQGPEYDVYPPELWEPYRTRRFSNGEQLYASIGIERADRPGRIGQFGKNFEFFGAPMALLIGIERRMGPPQWSDVGMFLQSFMLLAVENGLATCAQEAWTSWHEAAYEMLDLPDDVMLFCGIAIGHEDTEHPINNWRSDRAPATEWIHQAKPK